MNRDILAAIASSIHKSNILSDDIFSVSIYYYPDEPHMLIVLRDNRECWFPLKEYEDYNA